MLIKKAVVLLIMLFFLACINNAPPLPGVPGKVSSREEISALLGQGIQFLSSAQYKQAVDILKKAVDLYQKEQYSDNALFWDLKYNLGLGYLQLAQAECALLHLLEAYRIAGQLPDAGKTALTAQECGQAYYLSGNFQAALPYFLQALSFYQEQGEEHRTALISGKTGWIYYSFAQYSKAEAAFSITLQLAEKLAETSLVARSKYALGTVYYATGDTAEALRCFEQGLSLAEQTGDQGLTAECLSSLGTLFQAQGHYDKALEHFTRAWEIHTALKADPALAADLLEIGTVYKLWGLLDQALEYYTQSRTLAESIRDREILARGLFLTGELFTLRGEWEAASEYLELSLDTARQTGNQPLTVANLALLGKIFTDKRQWDKAQAYFDQAETLALFTGNRLLLGRIRNANGLLYLETGEYEKSYAAFHQALSLDEEMGMQDHTGEDCHYLGVVSLKLNRPGKAASWLQRSLAVKEKLRLTATAFTRRDFLASEIKTYHILLALYTAAQETEKAFAVNELISARYLQECISGKYPEETPGSGLPGTGGIKAFQAGLDTHTAVLEYIYTVDNRLIILVATAGRLRSLSVDLADFTDSLPVHLPEPALLEKNLSRGLYKVTLEEFLTPAGIASNPHTVEYVINYYHYLLARDTSVDLETGYRALLGKALYELLLAPVNPYLDGITRLLIIPGAVCAALPFETLLLPDGRYCIEQYTIHYHYSLALIDSIRTRSYNNSRNPLIAFGGALYAAPSPLPAGPGKSIPANALLGGMQGGFTGIPDNAVKLPALYASPHLSDWKDLPYSLDEVESIGNLFPGSRVITGAAVNKTVLKQLSRDGVLKQYKRIHFATHALVTPFFPALSCLVLSNPDAQAATADAFLNADRYLLMEEISALDLHADFVNLSACETGLGKVYQGEGVVGLAQAFMLAGANSAAVSLWKVTDQATRDFMIRFYTLLQDRESGYAEVLRTTKMEMIHSTQYSSPFYWAPFVYYGL